MRNCTHNNQTCCGKAAPPRSKFVIGVPKGSHWFRVSEEYLRKAGDYMELLEQFKLKTLPQDDDFALIYGDKEKSALFLEELGQITKESLEALEGSEGFK